jgi:hypothetical protein
VRVLNHEELLNGDVSLEYVSKLMHRSYHEARRSGRCCRTLWYQVNNGQEIYVVGVIQPDDTVRGGTGWGTEFAKLCNKPLYVFDQDRGGWFRWNGSAWDAMSAEAPLITHPHFTGTGTRHIKDNAKKSDRRAHGSLIRFVIERGVREHRAGPAPPSLSDWSRFLHRCGRDDGPDPLSRCRAGAGVCWRCRRSGLERSL